MLICTHFRLRVKMRQKQEVTGSDWKAQVDGLRFLYAHSRAEVVCRYVRVWILPFQKEEKKMHNELTKQDIKKMEEEIEHRKLVVRKQALEDVKEARAQGDLSENFEYYAAKRFKNQNESRIRYLERMIKTAVVVSDESAEDEIGMNNTVEVFFEEDNTTETYKIVTTVRGNSLEGLISTESPLGKALLGHKVGDRVYVEVNPNVGYHVVVKSIENTVDDGSDKLRSF